MTSSPRGWIIGALAVNALVIGLIALIGTGTLPKFWVGSTAYDAILVGARSVSTSPISVAGGRIVQTGPLNERAQVTFYIYDSRANELRETSFSEVCRLTGAISGRESPDAFSVVRHDSGGLFGPLREGYVLRSWRGSKPVILKGGSPLRSELTPLAWIPAGSVPSAAVAPCRLVVEKRETTDAVLAALRGRLDRLYAKGGISCGAFTVQDECRGQGGRLREYLGCGASSAHGEQVLQYADVYCDTGCASGGCKQGNVTLTEWVGRTSSGEVYTRDTVACGASRWQDYCANSDLYEVDCGIGGDRWSLWIRRGYSCPQGCAAGACVGGPAAAAAPPVAAGVRPTSPAAPLLPSEAYVRESTPCPGGFAAEDQCLSASVLNELECDPKEPRLLKSTLYTCPKGCRAGACVQ